MRGVEVLNQVMPIYLIPLRKFSVYVSPAVHTHLIGRVFNACNSIDNYYRIWYQSKPSQVRVLVGEKRNI